MNNKSRYLFKNLGILTISNLSSKILIFLLVPIYTSVLTTTEYGVYDLIISTVSLLFPILTLNIVDAVMRFCMDSRCSKNEIAIIGLKYIIGSVAILGFLVLLVNRLELFPSINRYLIYLFIFYVVYVLNQYFIQLAKGHEFVKDMCIAGILSTIVMLGANVFFLLFLDMGLNGFFVANILAQLIQIIYFTFALRYWRYIRFIKISKKLEKEMLIYCIPLIFTVLGWWINSAADKYIVTLICGVAANGILSVSYKIPSILQTVQGIFTQAWQISAVKEYGTDEVSVFYGCTFRYINVFMSITCATLIFLSKPLASILFANDFYVAWQYVPFLLISSVLNCASGFIGPILSAKKDSKSMALSALYGSGTNIILNVLMIFSIGIQGATIATVISSYIIYYFRKKAVKEDLKIEQYWKVISTWLLLIVQALLEIYTTMWYVEVVIILLIVSINWNVIRNAICSFKKK